MARNKSPMFRIDAGTTTTAAELDRAQAMGHSRAVPYLDWWALANSADIVVRRHAGCIAQASTFSTTARAWGLDVERAARRARPDFDGLV